MGAIGLRSGKRKQDPPQRIVLATALLADDEGTSVVEFALIAPVLVLLLLGAVDIGTAIYDRFALNAAVSAAEQYAILSASAVSSSSEAQLAQSLGTIVAGADFDRRGHQRERRIDLHGDRGCADGRGIGEFGKQLLLPGSGVGRRGNLGV